MTNTGLTAGDIMALTRKWNNYINFILLNLRF